MSGRYITIALLAALMGCEIVDKDFECSFNRIGGTYATSQSELHRTGQLIFVQGADGREYAFNRNQLQVCEEFD